MNTVIRLTLWSVAAASLVATFVIAAVLCTTDTNVNGSDVVRWSVLLAVLIMPALIAQIVPTAEEIAAKVAERIPSAEAVAARSFLAGANGARSEDTGTHDVTPLRRN